MLNVFLISMAASALGSAEPVVFKDDEATIEIRLAPYDLARNGEQQRLRRKVAWAADKVCHAALPGAIEPEIFACVKGTLAEVKEQLDRVIARHATQAASADAIGISAATNLDERTSK